ncbi:hypothetical protein EG327_001374 [Venturia inaequalis]|uniref:Glutamyl-tRNA(Gln) amidotransferase subunit A, mitochondrial n=1 Tax=Venturia inaequalis TaxID=5025 RepID=A0A8H3VN50_VENIN|nr:hypothetical protein EG327_001374 [Venturia inaequalis]
MLRMRIRPIEHVVSAITLPRLSFTITTPRLSSAITTPRLSSAVTTPRLSSAITLRRLSTSNPTKTFRIGRRTPRRAPLAPSVSKPAAATQVCEKRLDTNENAFITPPKHGAHFEDDGLDEITNKPIAIKDNISTEEYPTTCASGILKDFQSPYDATVVTLLKEAGALISGKTNMDEFGMGSHSTHSHFGAVISTNGLSVGGSSGGSAVAVRSHPEEAWASLGTDTGGSVRLPAAYCRVLGFKPSYGRLSRWGVVSYANSLDTVGIFATEVARLEAVYDVLNQHDPKDPTSMTDRVRSRCENPGLRAEDSRRESLRIGVPMEYNISELSNDVREAWIKVLIRFKSVGHTIVPISLPSTQHALSAYYILAPAEASSNLAKYDGIRYGSRTKAPDGADGVLFSQTRGQGLGEEVKRRILLGSYTLSADAIDNYFVQAQKIRRLVQDDFNRVFRRPNPLDKDYPRKTNDRGVDIILCPTAPTNAPTLEDVVEQDSVKSYMNDIFTVPASLAGLPAINVPSSFFSLNGWSRAGIQLIGQYGDDRNVLAAAQDDELFNDYDDGDLF